MKILIAASTMVHIKNFHQVYIDWLKQEGHRVYVMARGEGADFNIDFKKRSLSFKNFKLSRRIKKIIQREGFDRIILHTSLASFWVRMALKGIKNRPYVINTVHGYLFGNSTSRLHNFVYLMCERLLRKQTDDILVMNDEDYLIATENRLSLGTVYKINGMGVDFDKLVPCETENTSKGLKSLLFVGEISKRKNQLFLVKAMKYLSEYRLILVGDGDQRGKIEKYVKKNGLQAQVTVTGFTNEAYRYIQECDIYVSASQIEGLPFNIMEAMYAKKPIVASNIKGHTDLLPLASLYELNSLDAYISAVKNVTVEAQSYKTDIYSIKNVFDDNMALYVAKEKSSVRVEEKQPQI